MSLIRVTVAWHVLMSEKYALLVILKLMQSGKTYLVDQPPWYSWYPNVAAPKALPNSLNKDIS